MADEAPLVKCAECGFLALRNRTRGGFQEADEYFRTRGATVHGDNPNLWPSCFVRRWPIDNEVAEQMGASNHHQLPIIDAGAVRAVLQRDRECSSDLGRAGYIPWEQGFSPMEHRKMLDEGWLFQIQVNREKEERAYREDQRRKDDEWRAEQRRLDQEWQRRQEQQQHTQAEAEKNRHFWTIVVTGIGATGVVVLATLASAFIQRGYWWWEQPPTTAVQAPPVTVNPPQITINNVLPTAAPTPPAP